MVIFSQFDSEYILRKKGSIISILKLIISNQNL